MGDRLTKYQLIHPGFVSRENGRHSVEISHIFFCHTDNVFSTLYTISMDIQSLSTPERILLAEELWDSVRTKSDEIEVTPEQIELLESRLTALASDGDFGDTWENVKKRVIAG